jgi:hypothetical protein
MWISNREIKASKIFAFTESWAAFLKSITDVDYKNLALLWPLLRRKKNEGLHTVLAYYSSFNYAVSRYILL